ncbi:MAG: ABC transporter permease [Deltaproteobacteria bacterium]|nr:ABC transporter permease [Deltaproteobacteria bacterium]
MRHSMRVLVAFFLRDMREDLSYRAALVIGLFGWVVMLSAFFFFARFVDSAVQVGSGVGQGGYLGFSVMGMVLMSLQQTALSAYPQRIRAAQLTGTLEAMLATPTSPGLVLIASPFYRFTRAIFSALVMVLLAVWLFDLRFAKVDVIALAVTLPLCLLAFASLGLLAASFTLVVRRSDPISAFFGGFSVLAGGVFFPTHVLPGWLRTLGEVLPITHGLQLVRRAAFEGEGLATLKHPLSMLTLFCVIVAPVGLVFFSWAVRRARRDGSMNHY